VAVRALALPRTPGVSSAVETRSGTLDADQSIGDVLPATDFALMGAFEARRGRWGLIADLLGPSAATRRSASCSRERVQTELTMLNGYAAYRVHEDERVGTRRDGRLPGGLARPRRDALAKRAPGPELWGRARDGSIRWSAVEPALRWAIAGLRRRWPISAGSARGSDRTWQVLGTVGYQFHERWSVQGGWRRFDIDTDVDGRDVDLELGGPVLGSTVRF
jgi:hypothetical protein